MTRPEFWLIFGKILICVQGGLSVKTSFVEIFSETAHEKFLLFAWQYKEIGASSGYDVISMDNLTLGSNWD